MIWFNIDKLSLSFWKGERKAIDLSLPMKNLFFYIQLYIEDAYFIVMPG